MLPLVGRCGCFSWRAQLQGGTIHIINHVSGTLWNCATHNSTDGMQQLCLQPLRRKLFFTMFASHCETLPSVAGLEVKSCSVLMFCKAELRLLLWWLYKKCQRSQAELYVPESLPWYVSRATSKKSVRESRGRSEAAVIFVVVVVDQVKHFTAHVCCLALTSLVWANFFKVFDSWARCVFGPMK